MSSIIMGALLMLMGLISAHAQGMAHGKLPEKVVWRTTATTAQIMFWVLTVATFTKIWFV